MTVLTFPEILVEVLVDLFVHPKGSLSLDYYIYYYGFFNSLLS